MIVAATVVAASLIFHVDAVERVNVVYNVACLAEQVPCTKAKYDKLWAELKWSPADQAHLDRWRSIVRAAEMRARPAPESPLLANYPSFFPSIRQRQSILQSALDATSVNAFERHVASVVPADDARALAEVLRHFQTRLHPWWQRVGRHRTAGARGVERSLLPAQRDLMGRVAAFVQADPRIRDVYMHVVPSPDVSDDEASGTVVRNHFFMELVSVDATRPDAAQASEMVVSVALHELTHALYESAPPATHAAVMRQFVDAPDRNGPSMYAFLNEAIATAVQEIAAEVAHPGQASDEGSGYRHAYIARLGRAAVAPIKAALAAGRTLTDGFTGDYLRSGRAALGADADTLAFTFSAVALLAAEPMQPAVRALREAMGTSYSVDSLPEWRQAGELNAVFLVDYDDVRQFADRIPDLPQLLTHRGFAFITPYMTRSHVLVLSGRDADAVTALIKQLSPSKPLPPDGAVLTLD
jgi:hypothetical protein